MRLGEIEAETLINAPDQDEQTLTLYLEAHPPSAFAVAALIERAKAERDRERQSEVAGKRYVVERAAVQWLRRRFALAQAAGPVRGKTKWVEAISDECRTEFPSLKMPDARRVAEHWLPKTKRKK